MTERGRCLAVAHAVPGPHRECLQQNRSPERPGPGRGRVCRISASCLAVQSDVLAVEEPLEVRLGCDFNAKGNAKFVYHLSRRAYPTRPGSRTPHAPGKRILAIGERPSLFL
jgi:hypothetical protein